MRMQTVRRPIAWWCVMLIGALLLSSCSTIQNTSKNSRLDRLQYDYSAAIRWGNFEGAWILVDPQFREKHPLTDADFSRYAQIQITTYNALDSATQADGLALREVQIDLVNRNTLSQRSVRYTERWRYDEKAGTWWLIDGLPDLWQGQ